MTYVRLIAALVVLGLIGTAIGSVYYFRSRMQLAEAEQARLSVELSLTKQVNEDNKKVIDAFAAQRMANDNFVRTLSEDIDAIAEKQADQTSALSELMRNDIPARDFLNAPLPDSVKRLLNPSAPAGR